MKKSYLMLAAVAALFAACSSGSDDVAERPSVQNSTTDQVPVAFDSYVNRGTSRAGYQGPMTITELKMAKVGFGVFGYYTNADSYDNRSFYPNFMYNQQVTFGTAWEYTPIKYWPNEFGTGALSEDVDKVSFFAYAPFVTVSPTSGKVNGDGSTTYTQDDGNATYGIVGMTRNNEAGDPMVKYISTFYTDQQVDLTWGTVKSASATKDWALKNGGDAQTLTAGLPWLDVQHPSGTAAAQKVDFDFKHSLAQLNVQVDTKVDGTDVENLAEPTITKVFIRSVTFEGFDTKGALNLNNVTAGKPLWYSFDGKGELNNGSEVTIQDGRKDGKEGLTAATKENVGINPVLVQSAVWNSVEAGVTGSPANLFCQSDKTEPDNLTDPIFVIPNGDFLKVTIEYDVLTQDDNLAGTLNDGSTKGSVVKNVITRYITATGSGSTTTTGALTLEHSKNYTIKLHIGLNSVQFDADISDWVDATGVADLPHNN